MNFVKFSRTPFLQNTSRRILLFLIYLTVSFCKEVLYICSNLLLLEKATKTHNFGIFSFCKYILYSILWMHFNYRSKHKHKKSCFVNARILEKKLRTKMKKWQIENSEKSEISEISEELFRVFLFPSFRFCPTAKIENSDLKIVEKIFPRFPRFPRFTSFRPGLCFHWRIIKSKHKYFIKSFISVYTQLRYFAIWF